MKLFGDRGAFLFLIYLILETSSVPPTSGGENPNAGTCQAISWLHPCEANGYDKMVPPRSSTEVSIQIYVESLGNFQTGTMDYDMDIYFVEWWHDQRLRHNHTKLLSFHDREQLNRIWLPDLYFANSKSARYNNVTVPNLVLKLYPNGDIRYSVRINLKVSCNMNLEAYPLDIQRCYLKIVSYGSTTNQMTVTWINSSDAIEMNPNIRPTDLKVYKIENGYCNGSYFNLEFSCLLATFYLKRDLGYSLLQLFIPTTFIVMISWISFWIDPSSVPGRVGLAVTTLLTLSTQAIGLQYTLPPVSYPKAQDVWFGVCILFLFAALVEFALVNMFTRRGENLVLKLKDSEKEKLVVADQKFDLLCCVKGTEHVAPKNVIVVNQQPVAESDSLHRTCVVYKRRVELIDKLSRWLFPVSFFLFCAGYWWFYVKWMR